MEQQQQQQEQGNMMDSHHHNSGVIDASELQGHEFIEIADISEMLQNTSNDFGGAVIAHDELVNEENNDNNFEDTAGNQSSFPCTMCPEGFDKKLLLNNHMKNKHGVNYVFTERGRKVKLVRLPEEGTPARHPGTSKDGEQHVFEIIEGRQGETNGDDQDQNDQGLGCGYAVTINTPAFEQAKLRKEIPFVAFFPLMSKHVYLLKIKEYFPTNHLLEPATKNDVINAFLKHSKNGSIRTAGDRLPIVAFLQQVYNKDSGSTDLSISWPMDMDLNIKIISQDKFTNLAFANPDADPLQLENELEIDDEEPIPPPLPQQQQKPKPVKSTTATATTNSTKTIKRRGRRTKKEIEQEKENARLKENMESAAAKPVTPLRITSSPIKTSVPVVQSPATVMPQVQIQKKEVQVQEEDKQDEEEDVILEMVKEIEMPSLTSALAEPLTYPERGFETPKRTNTRNEEPEPLPPKLVPIEAIPPVVQVKKEQFESMNNMEEEEESLPLPPIPIIVTSSLSSRGLKTPSPKKTRGKGRRHRRSRSKSKPKLDQSSTPAAATPSRIPPPTKKPKISRDKTHKKRGFEVPKKVVKQEPMEIEDFVEDNNKGLESEDEHDKDFIPDITCAPKRPSSNKTPGGGKRRGRPRKLKFDECTDEES